MHDDDIFGDDIFLDYTMDIDSIEKLTAAIKNLIDYSDRIYDLTVEKMCELESLRLQNKKEYEECLKRLRIYRIKEQRILDNIDGNIYYINFEEHINSLTDQLVSDPNKNTAIKQRINYIFEKKAAENNEYYDEELSSAFYRSNCYTKDAILGFMLRIKGKNIPRIIQYKYSQAFINRDVETELLYAGYDLNNIITMTEENKRRILNIDLDIYNDEKKEFYLDFTMATIKSLVEQSRNLKIDKNEVYNALDLIRFLLKKVPKSDLYIIEKECKNFLENDNTVILYKDVSVVDKLIELCTNKIHTKQKYKNSLYSEENENTESLSEELIDNLFNLIKQVSNTYDIAMRMCLLEIKNKTYTKEFKTLLSKLESSITKEKEIVSKIEISNSQKDVVVDILNTSINLIIDLNGFYFIKDLDTLCDDDSLSNRNITIRQRILNLIPELYMIDDSVYKSPNVPLYIIQSHLIEVLKEFEKSIRERENKSPLIVAKYEEIIANDDLTDDFVKAHGKVENMISFDDETLATLLEIELEEYKFDKSELLYNYITLTLQGLMENPIDNPNPLEQARIEFQGLFISIAANSVQDGLIEIVYEDELSEEELEEVQKVKKYTK